MNFVLMRVLSFSLSLRYTCKCLCVSVLLCVCLCMVLLAMARTRRTIKTISKITVIVVSEFDAGRMYKASNGKQAKRNEMGNRE